MFQDIYACTQMAQYEVAVRSNLRHRQLIKHAEAARSRNQQGPRTNLWIALRGWATSLRSRSQAPQS